jgi:hypothetical protein
MGVTGLVDCRVAVVVLEHFGFLCFTILVGGKACWLPWEGCVGANDSVDRCACSLGRLTVGSFWRLVCLFWRLG